VSVLFEEIRMFLIDAALRAARVRIGASLARGAGLPPSIEQHLRALARAKADALHQLQEGTR